MAPKPLDVVIRGQNETQGAFAQVTRSAEELEAKVTALNKPFESLKNVVAGVAGFMVVEFFRKTVEAAVEAEQAWARIGAAVSNAGIHIGGVHDKLEELFESMTKTSRFSERELADAFGTLLNVTNDYKASVENLDLVTNIAVARHMDLNQAATLVGRVLDGNTSMLKRYGIVLRDDGIAPMDQLRERFKGFAEKDAETLGGALARIANAWEKIQEAIGKAISGDRGGQGLDGFIGRLNRLAEFIEGHHASFDRLERLFNLMGTVQTQGIETLSPFARMMNRATGDAAGSGPSVDFGAAMMRGGQEMLAAREIDVNSAQRAAERKADAEKKAQKEILQAVQDRIKEVNEEEKEAEQAEKERAKEKAEYQKAMNAAIDATPYETDSNLLTKEGLAGLRVDPTKATRKRGVGGDGIDRKQLTKELKTLPGVMATLPHAFSDDLPKAVDVAKGAVLNFFDAWHSLIDEMIVHHGKLGAAIVATGRQAIGQVMSAQGQAAILKAGEAAAEGLWPPNPALLLKAGRLLAIGTAEEALGAFLGGGGGGGGSYGGGGGLSSSSALSQQSSLQRKTTTVVFKGGSFINLADPEQRAEFLQGLRDVYGDGDLNFLFE